MWNRCVASGLLRDPPEVMQMSSGQRVLLVAPTPALAKNLFAWLTEGGYDVALVTSFASAKVELQSSPHLLISEIRLGEYNGLHLATRAQSQDIPSVVIGHADPVLERDAQQMGVTYMHADVDRECLLVLAEHLTADARERAARAAQARGASGNLAFVSSGELATIHVPPRHGRRMH
jgi:DNA-binding NtrC family response regulator